MKTMKVWMAACAVSAGLCSLSFGQVTGTVKLDGEAPEMGVIDMTSNEQCAEAHADPVREETVVVGEENALANVVVSVKPPEGGELKGDAPKEPVALDQVGCRYVPHVVAVMVGQPFLVANSDNFLHNVHGLPIDNEGFNLAQPRVEKPGRKLTDKIKVAERFSIKCDIHPWMLAHVSAFEHPYFAVTDTKGAFSIPAGLEDGTYTLIFWHEKFGEQEVEGVEVKGGKAEKPVEFTFKQEAAAADAEAPVKLAALVEKAPADVACDSGSECCEATKAKKAVAAKGAGKTDAAKGSKQAANPQARAD